MQTFLAVSMVLNGFMAIIWNSSTWINIFLKAAFIAMAVWAGFLLATDLGYLVKV